MSDEPKRPVPSSAEVSTLVLDLLVDSGNADVNEACRDSAKALIESVVADDRKRTVAWYRDNVKRLAALVGFEPGTCDGCGAAIYWATTAANSRPHPIDVDGRTHFASCPKAGNFKGKRSSKP